MGKETAGVATGESRFAGASAFVDGGKEPLFSGHGRRFAGKRALLPENLLNLQHLLDVRLPLTIRLGSTRMPLEELLALTPGAILELDRQEDEPLELLANGQVVGRGEVVVVDERFGLRITEIGSPEDRARATL